MRNRGSIDVLAIVVCIGAAALTFFALWHLPPKQDSAVYRQIGQALAREALALRSSDGRLVVIARDTKVYRQPAMEIAVQEFQRQAQKANASVAMHLIELDPLRAVEVPPGDFYEAIRRAKSNDVIVSFMGPPVLEGEQEAKL